MASRTDTKTDAIRLMSTETNFERSVISGQQCRPDAAPRREEMPEDLHQELLASIARDEITYIVFSYRTPIAWVRRDGAVVLPDRKYSRTTSMHQNWVREAFGDRVNSDIPTEPVGDAPVLIPRSFKVGEHLVVLSENEEVILRRMRDEDGTEYPMIVKGLAEDGQKFCPRDQAEPLVTKGLASYLMNSTRGNYGIRLTDKGRSLLDQIQPVVRKSKAQQYAELGEDDLIALAAELGDRLQYGHQDFLQTRLADLTAVLEALKIRREASAPARKRIGEYLRHLDLNDREYERTNGRYISAREPKDILDELRADEHAGVARLRATDLVQVVQPIVRDSKHEFYMDQATILSSLEDVKLPEKQAALLPCIAQGHITRFTSGSYSGQRGCTCHLVDGRTANALMNKDFVGTRKGLGYRPTHTLMLVRPKTA